MVLEAVLRSGRVGVSGSQHPHPVTQWEPVAWRYRAVLEAGLGSRVRNSGLQDSFQASPSS